MAFFMNKLFVDFTCFGDKTMFSNRLYYQFLSQVILSNNFTQKIRFLTFSGGFEEIAFWHFLKVLEDFVYNL